MCAGDDCRPTKSFVNRLGLLIYFQTSFRLLFFDAIISSSFYLLMCSNEVTIKINTPTPICNGIYTMFKIKLDFLKPSELTPVAALALSPLKPSVALWLSVLCHSCAMNQTGKIRRNINATKKIEMLGLNMSRV